jgi:hypothetical protein
MSIPTIDTRKAWLDEIGTVTHSALHRLTEKEVKGVDLSAAEKQYAKICSAYLYLLNLAEENNILRCSDPDNPFKHETLH